MTLDTRPTTAPMETVTPIKPSEALRLGCVLAPVQMFGNWGEASSACALGAMTLGYGDGDGTPLPKNHTRTDAFWRRQPSCPLCGSAFGVECLNDSHRWSRERIADWLEGLGL